MPAEPLPPPTIIKGDQKMKVLPHKSYRARRSLLICLFILSITGLAAGQPPPPPPPASVTGWQVQVEEGQKTNATLRIINRCLEPHNFRIKNSIKYLSFTEPTKSMLIGPGSNRPLTAIFDSAGLKSQVYRDKVTVECLDCKKEKVSRCTQDRDEVQVQLTIKPATLKKSVGEMSSKPVLVTIKDGRLLSIKSANGSEKAASGDVFKAKASFVNTKLILELDRPVSKEPTLEVTTVGRIIGDQGTSETLEDVCSDANARYVVSNANTRNPKIIIDVQMRARDHRWLFHRTQYRTGRCPRW